MNKKNVNFKLRYNLASVFIYIVGAVLIIQLFNLQIIQGEKYREQSNTRLSRESTIQAARGNIRDQSGNNLASTKESNVIELYKTKVDNTTLNNSLYKMVQVLEANAETYIDKLPILVEPFTFTMNAQEAIAWKKSNKIAEDKTAEEVFYQLKNKYEIANENVIEARKIMTIRYSIEKNGYSSTKSVQIANIGEKSLAQISEQSASFPGIAIVTSPKRIYSLGTTASHILGYASKIQENQLKGKEDIYDLNDIIGQTGIEYIFEPYLRGTNGVRQIDMAVDGTVTDEHVSKEAIAGSDIILTIDANLQKVTEQALETSIKNIAAESKVDVTGGSAVVMNVRTGEVLAMASNPYFDPNDFVNGMTTEKWNYYNAEESNKPFMNRAISSPSSPGSTYKMVTAIAGLETGKIKLTEKINDTGVYKYTSDYNPKCWMYSQYGRGHGYLNVTGAIVHSCNYYFYEIGNRVGIGELAKYTKALGLGRKTGVELLGEESGYVASPETSKALGQIWNGGDTLSAAIGQGNNSFTTMQMAKYISMLTNGGKNIDVSIIKSIIDANGNEINKEELNKYTKEKLGIEEDTAEVVNFKEENLQAVLEGMKGVTTQSGGTAYSIFKNFNIEVGGKTGSAQTGVAGKTNAWFVGFAPYDEPEIAIVVMIENGQSGNNAAETARDIIAEYFGMNSNKVTEDMGAKPSTEIAN